MMSVGLWCYGLGLSCTNNKGNIKETKNELVHIGRENEKG
jgi:hypothetical protein